MPEPTFTWTPIYIELARKLIAYRHRQPELLVWLKEMKADGIPVVGLVDQQPAGQSVPLSEIDPFTFFATFNRSIKTEHRKRVLAILRENLAIAAAVPSDFDGIPVVHPQTAWFFPFEYLRGEDDISTLWEFAVQITEREPSTVDPVLFERCLDIMQVGLAKLTMGMFWLRPDAYIALDGTNQKFFEQELGISSAALKPTSLPEYLNLIGLLSERAGSDFPSISHRAYLREHPAKDPIEEGLRGYLFALADEAGRDSLDGLKPIILQRFKDGDTELTNREKHFRQIAEVLQRSRFTGHDVKSACSGLYLTASGYDAIRRNRFLATEAAETDVRTLCGGGPPDAERINAFIASAIAHGYANEKGKGSASQVAQFASVLLTSLYPEHFVDFRKSRWNELYSNVIGPDDELLTGSDYGQMALKAAAFARQIAQTQTFKEVFGASTSLWPVAAVAWALKDGLEAAPLPPPPPPLPPPPPTLEPWKLLSLPRNLILYGPPGTGKTWELLKTYVPMFGGQSDATKRWEMVTFHQSYSYEEFIEGIKPVVNEPEASSANSVRARRGSLRYEVKPGLFRTLVDRASKDPGQNYALFIDEINRGNVASIFGELITLIEEDKRQSGSCEVAVLLPYSRAGFVVPPNLFIIGTMNTADRSVEALDAALRRRFSFKHVAPEPELLTARQPPALNVQLNRMLETINRRLTRLLDADHTIGHAYFMNLDKAQDPFAELQVIFERSIVPLLQEYFYGAKGRIALVLGPRFVSRRDEDVLARVEWEEEYDVAVDFECVSPTSLPEAAFIAIYE